jgi:hypothetical protein
MVLRPTSDAGASQLRSNGDRRDEENRHSIIQFQLYSLPAQVENFQRQSVLIQRCQRFS